MSLPLHPVTCSANARHTSSNKLDVRAWKNKTEASSVSTRQRARGQLWWSARWADEGWFLSQGKTKLASVLFFHAHTLAHAILLTEAWRASVWAAARAPTLSTRDTTQRVQLYV